MNFMNEGLNVFKIKISIEFLGIAFQRPKSPTFLFGDKKEIMLLHVLLSLQCCQNMSKYRCGNFVRFEIYVFDVMSLIHI